jgi:hypothetical protein
MTILVTAWLAFGAGTAFGVLLIRATEGRRRRRWTWSGRRQYLRPRPLARPRTRFNKD